MAKFLPEDKESGLAFKKQKEESNLYIYMAIYMFICVCVYIYIYMLFSECILFVLQLLIYILYINM